MAVGESEEGSGLGSVASCRICERSSSERLEVVGTAKALAYRLDAKLFERVVCLFSVLKARRLGASLAAMLSERNGI